MDIEQNLYIGKASGKVLIAGGYGVLEEDNYGLTLALSNSLYCICQNYDPIQQTNIIVRSPQINGLWQYKWNPQQNKMTEVKQNQNTFVCEAIKWTLAYLDKKKNAGRIHLKIVNDRGFISECDAIDQQSRFPKYKEGYHKTGLGSSACVIVSIIKCLFKILQPTHHTLKIVNIISQLANLSAQKKIGSNFDISTAVFGTHLYKNVFPRKLFPLLQQANNFDKQKLGEIINIDPQIGLISNLEAHKLCGYIVDVKKGADTRVMVSGFISKLNQCQETIRRQFFAVSKDITLSLYKTLNCFELNQCRKINKMHRQLQQKYSKITGVPIEPQDLSPLIDRIIELPEICYAICPGSGGYDAIFILAVKDIFEELLKVVDGEHGLRKVELLLTEEADTVSESLKNELKIVYQHQ